MSISTGKIVEGVFAINKPPSISSAEVIRRLQHSFNPSKLFAPWIKEERSRRNREIDRHNRNKKKDKRVDVKMGHGGTLDPMATGVLILGLGRGTKHLQSFLQCTKTYEATVLFGAATDTYDTMGKVLQRGSCIGLTREKVDQALERYRGKIMQRPPIYSALRVNGKRLYEYAREGRELPGEIEKRPVEVQELEIVEWLEGRRHDYILPKEEADTASKELAEKMLHLNDFVAPFEDLGSSASNTAEEKPSLKRKRVLDDGDESTILKKPNFGHQEIDPQTLMSGALQPVEEQATPPTQSTTRSMPDMHPPNPQQESPLEDLEVPAVKLRMTVTSGFYVRSLCHDLGETLGSLACMSALVRLRQGQFQLGRNVLEYEEIGKGEEVWGPSVKGMLDEWVRETDGQAEYPDSQRVRPNHGEENKV